LTWSLFPRGIKFHLPHDTVDCLCIVDMKPGIISIIVVCISLGLFAAASCWKTAPVVNLKDLNENMVDIRIYQENLGDYVRSGTSKMANGCLLAWTVFSELWQTSLMNIGNYQNHFLTSIIKSSKRQSAN